jgi:hypothetical protein
MYLSLGRIGGTLRRNASHTRILAVTWSAALVLALTPCCEVFASALPSDHPAGHGQADAHAQDAADSPNGSHGDIGDGLCAPWLNTALSTLDDAPALLPQTSSPENPATLLRDSELTPALARRPDVYRGVHAPPPAARPLYLRLVRFLE